MKSHWRPRGEIVRIAWTSPEAYGFKRHKAGAPGYRAMLLLAAAGLGMVGAAAWRWWPSKAPPESSTSAIEWNSVQAVPKRAPDPEDVEWERRAQEDPGASSGEAQQTTFVRPASEETESPRTSAPRDELHVIDGDTFSYRGERVRVVGMDAPETHPPRCTREAQLGLAATAKLDELLSSGTVTIGGNGRDRYGRELRQVFVNGVDVAQTMIAAGLANSYSGGKRQGWC